MIILKIPKSMAEIKSEEYSSFVLHYVGTTDVGIQKIAESVSFSDLETIIYNFSKPFPNSEDLKKRLIISRITKKVVFPVKSP